MVTRTEHLKKLSWEHHDALKFARRIAQGLSLGIDPKEIAEYAVSITDKFLLPHFALEKSALISRLTEDQCQNDTVQRVLEEHRTFASLNQQMQHAEGDELYDLLGRCALLIKNHVRLEENHLFPYIERTLTPDGLLQVQSEIDEGHLPASTDWAKPGWVS